MNRKEMLERMREIGATEYWIGIIEANKRRIVVSRWSSRNEDYIVTCVDEDEAIPSAYDKGLVPVSIFKAQDMDLPV